MKVLLLNGSPHPNGCTFTALSEISKTLSQEGIESEILQIGDEFLHGCVGCYQCGKLGKCVFDDRVNQVASLLPTVDGLIVGSPVYYAGMAGNLKVFLDRLFYSAGRSLAYKPAAAVVSARRGGCATTFDDINKYFLINRMPVVGSQYWNQVHGSTPEDVAKDKEGLQTMQTLGKNMAWLLRCIDCAKQQGIDAPPIEPVIRTNFI